jgi:hypothetical protein
MVFNTTFNYLSVISWLSVLLLEKTEVLGENHNYIVVEGAEVFGRKKNQH